MPGNSYSVPFSPRHFNSLPATCAPGGMRPGAHTGDQTIPRAEGRREMLAHSGPRRFFLALKDPGDFNAVIPMRQKARSGFCRPKTPPPGRRPRRALRLKRRVFAVQQRRSAIMPPDLSASFRRWPRTGTLTPSEASASGRPRSCHVAHRPSASAFCRPSCRSPAFPRRPGPAPVLVPGVSAVGHAGGGHRVGDQEARRRALGAHAI
jgi:hypothetical protein